MDFLESSGWDLVDYLLTESENEHPDLDFLQDDHTNTNNEVEDLEINEESVENNLSTLDSLGLEEGYLSDGNILEDDLQMNTKPPESECKPNKDYPVHEYEKPVDKSQEPPVLDIGSLEEKNPPQEPPQENIVSPDKANEEIKQCKKTDKPAGRIPCMVCGGVSSGCHFGVISCESCKVFFRRNMLKESPYTCIDDNNCIIPPGRHASCSACRLKKCRSVGMAKEKAKKGRYTTEKKKDYKTMIERIEEKQRRNHEEKMEKLQSNRYNIEQTVARMRYVHMKNFDQNEETVAAMNKVIVQKKNERKVMESVIGPLPSPSQSEIHDFYQTTGLDISGFKEFVKNHWQCWARSILDIVNYAKDLQEFMDLCLQDRISLLKGALHDCYLVPGFKNIDPENKLIICGACGGCLSEREYQFFGNISEYKQEFPPAEILMRLNLTLEETAVLRAFVIFDSSHSLEAEPQDAKKIDSIQNHLMNCLLYVLRENRGPENASKVYANIIRALTENRTQHYNTIKNRQKAAEIITDMKVPRFMAEMYHIPESSVDDLGSDLSSLNIA